ncbi:MAG: hypothetical protein ACNA71_06000 [Kiritimatiellia bacterium]
MKRLLRSIFLITGFLLVCGIAIYFCIPLWTPPIIERVLSHQLGTEIKLEGIQVHALLGRTGIARIEMAQPEGFPQDIPFLTITKPQLRIRLSQLPKLHLLIPQMQINQLDMHIIRNKEGRLNLEALAANRPVKEEAGIEGEEKPQAPRDRYPTVTITQCRMLDARITITDLSASPPVLLTITNLAFEAHSLRFDPVAAATSTNMFGRAQVTGTLLQPDLPDGYFGFTAAFGILSTNIPPVNAAMRLVGFDLRSIRGQLVPGIATAIGGSNLDVAVDASVADDYLRIQNRLYTANSTYRLGISGTPHNIHIDKSTALFNLVARPRDFVTGTIGDVTDAGITAGRTVVSTAERAGRGLFGNIMNIGKGASRTVTSAARGDFRGAGSGVVDMTYGTVTGVVDTVTGTARTAGEGVGDTISAASGRSQTRDWQQNNLARWGERWEEAEQFVDSTPFPGTIRMPIEAMPDADKVPATIATESDQPNETDGAPVTPVD